MAYAIEREEEEAERLAGILFGSPKKKNKKKKNEKRDKRPLRKGKRGRPRRR